MALYASNAQLVSVGALCTGLPGPRRPRGSASGGTAAAASPAPAEPGRTRPGRPCAGKPVAAGRSHVAALGPGRARSGVGGASSRRAAAPKRSAAGGTQTGWGGSVRAHGEGGQRSGGSTGILSLRRGT